LTRRRVVLLGALVLLLYLGMEWLFLVTKPSFTGMMGPLERVTLLAAGFLLAALLVLPVLLLLSLASVRLALAAVAALLGSLYFLMADNFLYTVLDAGTLNSPPFLRGAYTLLFLALCWLAYRQLRKAGPPRTGILLAVLGLLLALAVISIPARTVEAARSRSIGVESTGGGRAARTRPNVVIVGLDGVEANALPLYGNPLETSPFLASIAHELLIFDSAFPDAGKTTGTLTALLTGRSPLETRVGFPPQVLLGARSFLHLPSVLNGQGYHGFQHTLRYYADAGDLNFRDSFERANGRSLLPHRLERTALVRWVNNELHFLQTLAERLVKRLRYISFQGEMLNLYHLVQENQGLGYERDVVAVEDFERFVSAAGRRPFYAHLHLMSTHCCAHDPRSRAFSAADTEEANAEVALQMASRLNAIRDVDALVERIYRTLQERALLDDTVLLIYSDHSYIWDSVGRVPLLLRFAGREQTGRYAGNVLLSMVPAILLDYLDIPRPPWMKSAPDLSHAANPDLEPLFGLRSFDYERFPIGTGNLSTITDPGPPNYGIAELFMVLCAKRYAASLSSGRILIGDIAGHPQPCSEELYPDQPGIQTLFQEIMDRYGLVWGSPADR
jgi:hypothetical protein